MQFASPAFSDLQSPLLPHFFVIMNTKTYGWGLIGPGRFAKEFASELTKNPKARCVAVASRNAERARAFASEFGFETSYDSYEALVSDAAVDIVYVVVPHVFHREIAEMAIRAGKAVLCEKPLTPSSANSKALTELAREEGVFLMEAMKTGFLPAIQKAKEWIETGRIGRPKLARADFCFQGPSDPEDRLMNPNLGGGAVLDVGIYPIYLTWRLLGEIETIHAAGDRSITGVEDSVSIAAQHASGASSAMTCSFCTGEAMDAVIQGTEGSIRLPKFHAGVEAEFVSAEGEWEVYRDDSRGMVGGEIEAVMRSLDEGKIECDAHNHQASVRLAELMDEVIAQVR